MEGTTSTDGIEAVEGEDKQLLEGEDAGAGNESSSSSSPLVEGEGDKKVKKKKKKSGSTRKEGSSKSKKKKDKKLPVPSLDLQNPDSATSLTDAEEETEVGGEAEDEDAFLPRRSISVDGEEIFTDEDIQNYPFSEPDADSNVLFTAESAKTPRPVVKAGTLEKLIQRLTWEAYPDPVYMNAFLLTYRSFTTPQELLQLLRVRYNVPLPTRATSAELEQFIKTHQNPIRLRVFNVAKRWLSDHFYDFAEDRTLVHTLNETIIRAMLTSPDVSMQKAGEQLASLLRQKEEGTKREMKIQHNKPPPPSILPPGFSPTGTPRAAVKWLEFDPVELARQLTLIEYSLYRAIKPQECLGQAWTKKTSRDDKARNIMLMIQRFNLVSRWVTTEVVKATDLRARAAVLARFIDLASACEKLNNYNATMEILSGLQSSAIYRLKHTWSLLKKEHKKKWKEVTELLAREQNFQKFREHLHNVDPPCIPYLGVYLTDLTFIEDGNKDFINDSLINFDKRRKIAQVIMEIQQYQATPYCLEEVPALRDFFLNLDTFDENEAYAHSLQVEPKGMPPPTKTVGASWNDLKAKALKKIEKSKQASKEAAGQKEKDDSKPEEEEEEEEEDWGELEHLDDYPFGVPDSKDNIILDVDVSTMIEGAVPTIKAATLEKLIEKLTNERYCDPALVDSFLLTHAMFSTSAEVMALLKKRFSVPLPRDRANQELQDRYHQAKVLPVRLRVFNMAKHWIDRYSHRCLEDERFMAQLDDLIHVMLDAGMEKVAATLRHSLQRQKEGGYNYEAARRQTLTDPTSAETGQSGGSSGAGGSGSGDAAAPVSSLLELDPEELACQLCLTQQRLYNAIRPWEVLVHGCVKKGGSDSSTTTPTTTAAAKEETPQYQALVEHNERLVGVVVASIVTQDSTEAATGIVNRWVRVADKCLGHNNFNAVVHILAGILHPDLLKVLWAGLPYTTKAKVNKLKDMVDADNHYSKLQDKLHRSQPPCIPHIGAFVEMIGEHFEKMPDKVGPGGLLINFEKFALISAEVSEFQQYQPVPYRALAPSLPAQRWLAAQRMMSPEEVSIMAARLGFRRQASKTMLLTKIEQRRSQHTTGPNSTTSTTTGASPGVPPAIERSSSFSSEALSTNNDSSTDESAGGEDAGSGLGSSTSGLGSSPSMTKKLKKAFSSKPSTISRTSSVRSSRTTPPSPTPLTPPSPLTARGSVKSTGYSSSPVPGAPAPGSSTGAVSMKDEFMKLLKQDAEFRQAVLADIVQSQEMQELLQKEREEARRQLQAELLELKEALFSELAAQSARLEARLTAAGSVAANNEAEAQASHSPAAAPGEEPKPKPKLNLPDFG